jgi:hypothetical protein
LVCFCPDILPDQGLSGFTSQALSSVVRSSTRRVRQQFGVAAKARDCVIAPSEIAMTDHPLNSIQSE